MNYDVHDPSRLRATCSSFLAMAAPSVAGTGLVGFTVAMTTQYSGSAIEVRRGEPAAAQAEGKKTHTPYMHFIREVYPKSWRQFLEVHFFYV